MSRFLITTTDQRVQILQSNDFPKQANVKSDDAAVAVASLSVMKLATKCQNPYVAVAAMAGTVAVDYFYFKRKAK